MRDVAARTVLPGLLLALALRVPAPPAVEGQAIDLPRPPMPYVVEEVDFPGGWGDVRQAGTLTVPAGPGPFPAVALLSVSGPADRDQSLGAGRKPFLVLADHLTRRGIAVLRTDDPGVGASTGHWSGAGLEERIADARAALSFLVADERVDATRVGLVGNSEGAVVAAGATVEDDRAAFVVLLGAPGASGFELIRDRALSTLRRQGASEEEREAAERRFERLRDLVVSDRPRETVREDLRRMLDEGPLLPPYGFVPRDVEGQLDLLTSPWYRAQLTTDPAPILAALERPTLVLTGGLDQIHPSGRNLPPILRALSRGGNPDHTVARLPGLNHYMQPARTGGPAEAPTLERSFGPLALETIADWILARFGGG